MAQPNILLIMSDQHRPDCYGFAGRNIQTPHLDRLASEGARFNCAVTPNVLCQPSRASLLTGMMPLTHGVYDNQISLDPAIGEQGWARQLANVGYHSKFIGKAHFGVADSATPWGSPEARAHSENFPEHWNGPYMGFDDLELMNLGHWHELLPCEKPPRGQHFERWFWSHPDPWVRWAEDSRTGKNANYGIDADQTWHSNLPAEWHSTTWVTERAVNFLNSRQSGDKPFCAWVSYPDPHHPFDCPEPWASLHKPEAVDISRSHQRDLYQRPWWHQAALEGKPTGEKRNQILRTQYSRMQPQSDDQLRAMTANYFNMIAFIDDGVGKILDTLAQTGLDRETYVIFTSDHGELLGDHGLYLKGPWHYDNLLRVGMLVRGPGIDAGQVNDSPVCTLDLAQTFCDWGGAVLSDRSTSRSLRPTLERGESIRAHVMNEWDIQSRRLGVPLKLRTARSEHARLTVELGSGAGELYDFNNDPDEMINLWDDPAASGLKQEMLDRLESE